MDNNNDNQMESEPVSSDLTISIELPQEAFESEKVTLTQDTVVPVVSVEGENSPRLQETFADNNKEIEPSTNNSSEVQNQEEVNQIKQEEKSSNVEVAPNASLPSTVTCTLNTGDQLGQVPIQLAPDSSTLVLSDGSTAPFQLNQPIDSSQPQLLLQRNTNNLFLINGSSLAGKTISSIQMPLINYLSLIPPSTTLAITTPTKAVNNKKSAKSSPKAKSANKKAQIYNPSQTNSRINQSSLSSSELIKPKANPIEITSKTVSKSPVKEGTNLAPLVTEPLKEIQKAAPNESTKVLDPTRVSPESFPEGVTNELADNTHSKHSPIPECNDRSRISHNIVNIPPSSIQILQKSTDRLSDVSRSSKRKRPHSLLQPSQEDFFEDGMDGIENTPKYSKEKSLFSAPRGRKKFTSRGSSMTKLRVIGATRVVHSADQRNFESAFESLRNLFKKREAKMKELIEKCIKIGKVEYTVTIEGSAVNVDSIRSHLVQFEKTLANDFRRMELAANALEKLYLEVSVNSGKGAGIQQITHATNNNDLLLEEETKFNKNSNDCTEGQKFSDSLDNKKKHMCKICNTVFFSVKSLSRHLENDHSSEPSREKPRKKARHKLNEACDVCGRRFHSVILLNMHRASFHAKRTGILRRSVDKSENGEESLIDHNYSKIGETEKPKERRKNKRKRKVDKTAANRGQYISIPITEKVRQRGRPKKNRRQMTQEITKVYSGDGLVPTCSRYLTEAARRKSEAKRRAHSLIKRATSVVKKPLAVVTEKKSKTRPTKNDPTELEETWNLPYFDPDIPLDCSENNPIILLEPLDKDIISAFKNQSNSSFKYNYPIDSCV